MFASHTFDPWGVLLLAIVLAGASFAVQGRQGIGLTDEGFLWYGAQQTAHGKVPLRDFQSYDPGRYYWSAAGMRLLGDGLVSLRFSETLFQILGLWVGLLAASRVAQNWALLAAVGVMLTLWMVPSHKLFDSALLLCAIWIAVRLIEEPSPVRIFTAGFFVGMCIFFGRNHAVYNFLAQASLLLLLHFKLRTPLAISHLGMWVAGIITGLVPTIAMFVGAPGFFASYIESVQSIFRHGANLSLPVPWPWRVSLNSTIGATQFLLGIFLFALPLGYFAAIIGSLLMRSHLIQKYPLLIACAFVGVFYLHHAFSRADVSHLAQVIHPFLLGALALLGFLGARQFYYWAVIGLLIAAGLFTIGRWMPLYERITSSTPWVACDAGGKIFVPISTNRLLTCLREFAAENIATTEGVLIAPFAPTLYPILNREPPLSDLVYLFPATARRQEAMIQELTAKNVNWAIISDAPWDKREDRRFSATHKLIWQYLMENFEPVESACLAEPMKIFHRKNPADLIPK
jgi:hypothetical protein